MARVLAILAALYLSQGLPYGFFTQALPVLMRDAGMSLPAIGFSSLLAAPWALKFLWAPLVDATGRRATWIVSLQTSAAALATLLAFADGALWLLMVAVLVANLLAATQDVATDGLAVDVLDERGRGPGNGVQVAAYRGGMVIGGGALLWVFDRHGWSTTFFAMAALLGVLVLPALSLRDAPRARRTARPVGVSRAVAWIDVLRRPRMARWLIVIAAYKAFDGMAEGMVKPFLVDAGWSIAKIGGVVGTIAFGAALFGALLGGFLVGQLGRMRGMAICAVAEALMIVAWCLPTNGLLPVDAAAYVVAIEHLAGGMSTAALFTLMMDACRKETGATDYTVQASVVVVATAIGIAASGLVAEAAGYGANFVVAAIGFGACAVALLTLVRGGGVPR